QLRDAVAPRPRPRPSTPPPPSDPRTPPSPFYLVVESGGENGSFVLRPFDVDAAPELSGVPVNSPVTVPSRGGADVRWRALKTVTADETTTIAVPLTQNEDTVARLVGLQLVVGSAVLAILALAAYFVIRRSLRPLRRVENIAAAIARGDLFRRVPVRGTNTEVDRLSQSLNEMLAQIQSAFAATEASETAARESEARMRRFVADAGHELRTPLTTIRGFAELYRQGATGDP